MGGSGRCRHDFFGRRRRSSALLTMAGAEYLLNFDINFVVTINFEHVSGKMLNFEGCF